MVAAVDHWTDEAGRHVLERLLSEELPVKPKRVEITAATDAFEDEAWRVLLILPAPSGESETWDREAVFKARRAAVGVLDELAAADGHVLPGRTVALVTTDEASESDTAPEDEPEIGEDPGRRG